MTHASLDDWAFVFPVFQPGNLLVLISAPMAQCAFFILARKTPWLLNTYLAISVLCCAVAWLHLANDRETYGGGYNYTYWHQGDLLCRSDGCNDVLLFGYLILLQGLVLVFVPSVFSDFSDFWRVVLKVLLKALILCLILTSFALTLSI